MEFFGKNLCHKEEPAKIMEKPIYLLAEMEYNPDCRNLPQLTVRSVIEYETVPPADRQIPVPAQAARYAEKRHR